MTTLIYGQLTCLSIGGLLWESDEYCLENIMQEDKNILIRNLFNNISNTFNTIPQNSFSFKIVYYLDYLYLRKK